MDDQKKIDLLKILLIDHDGEFVKKIEAVLNSFDHPPFQIRTASTLADGLKEISASHVDLIFLNLFLPDCQGMETLTKTNQASGAVPIIVLDDSDDLSRGFEAARQGARDYFPKNRMRADDLWAAIFTATASRQRGQALQKSMVKFRNIIETLEDAYYETDLDGRFTYVNTTFCNHLQWSRKELISRRRREFSSGKTVQKLENVLKEVYFTGATSQIVEDELLRRDGTILYAELSITLMRDLAGHPAGYSCLSRDVTEKRNAESALALSESKYRNILACIEESYFETDLRGRILFCNDVLLKHLGYSRQELMEMSHRSYSDDENAEKLFQAYRRIYQTGEPIRALQYEIIHKNGEKRSVESSIALIRDANGQPIGYRGLGRDITKRKKDQEALARAKSRAEEAALAKNDFLSNMSHEIRTPLNAIFGMYDLLLTTELTQEQADFVATGKRSAEGLLAIINDIMDFSKIEAGQLDIEVIDFDLRLAVQEITVLPAMQAHAKGLEYCYRIDSNVPSLLKGDPGRLRQIIMNLSTNAVKFTQTGEVVLSVDLVEEASDRLKLRFSVKDTGIGISKADQARLFQAFQQVDASTTRKYGGTGLGLAISKRLAEMMGGEMGVTSETNQGATFWFTAVFEKRVNARERVVEIPASIINKRILIVDDNQTNLDILDGYLKQWGCDCDQATSGAMALALMAAVAKTGVPYDLVISDMLMPDMDGAELGRRIKADPNLTDTLMIMLTSQGLRGDAAEMKRIGFTAYLVKPVGQSQLLDCVMSVINFGNRIAAEPELSTADAEHSPPKKILKGIRILLAEDNPVNQKLALKLLAKAGCSADAVINGRLAVEALGKKSYDLVLMDIQMPEMDGVEATKIIRNPGSSVQNHAIPIIALTAHAMKGDHEKFLSVGMDGYVSKPIQPDLLFTAIEKAISGQRDIA